MAQVLMLKMWGRLASLERSKSYVELETRRSARGTQGSGLATVTDVNRALERLARASDDELPAAWDALSRVVREYAAPGGPARIPRSSRSPDRVEMPHGSRPQRYGLGGGVLYENMLCDATVRQEGQSVRSRQWREVIFSSP